MLEQQGEETIHLEGTDTVRFVWEEDYFEKMSEKVGAWKRSKDVRVAQYR